MPEKNNNLADDDKKKNSSGDSKPTQKRGTQRRRPTFRKRRSGHYNVNKKRDDEANPEEKSSSPGEKPQVKTHSRPQNKTPRLVPSNKSVSVVIPLYNEEESLKELSYKLYQVLDGLNCNYEVIFIDDGSTDSSYKKIQEINSKNSRFHCIKFRRNYGKSAALAAGFKEAKGDIVITMDADLQDDPDEIPSLIEKLNEGYDLVSGWKKVRYDPFIKKHTSKFFNYVTSKVSGIRLHDFNCGLKAYKKDVVKNVQIYGEMHRYVPALAYMMGFKVTEKPVKHHARKFGVTKFGPSRFLNGFLDLMTVAFTTKFMSRPLHLFGILGILSFICGFVIMAYLTVMKYAADMSISDRPLFQVGILFTIVGVQFLSLGLIAEMITKTTSREADYLIESKI